MAFCQRVAVRGGPVSTQPATISVVPGRQRTVRSEAVSPPTVAAFDACCAVSAVAALVADVAVRACLALGTIQSIASLICLPVSPFLTIRFAGCDRGLIWVPSISFESFAGAPAT